ncbi:RteC domain-containing protein [Wandonia haliotis]|uniref:RteC domain-containing protein n=1 Tax=Wandonia haliotis TaxID=574963 RepID=A0ABP3Y3E6_9FLAO
MLSDFEKSLSDIEIEIDDILKLSEVCTQYCEAMIAKLKVDFLNRKKLSESEEITFFKNIKPLFVSRLIYYISIYNIETNRPNGSIKIKRKYLQIELNKLKNYFDENLDFYRYYRTGSNYLDHKYFVRGKQDLRLSLDAHTYEFDNEFCTSHDFKISTILANDLLQVHLENELMKLDFNSTTRDTEFIPKNMMRWTGSKVSLIELMYALHQSGSFNNGQTDIKSMAAYLEKIFDIELGNYYRTWLELKIRQNPTKFLDSLADSLNRRIEEDDEK